MSAQAQDPLAKELEKTRFQLDLAFKYAQALNGCADLLLSIGQVTSEHLQQELEPKDREFAEAILAKVRIRIEAIQAELEKPIADMSLLVRKRNISLVK